MCCSQLESYAWLRRRNAYKLANIKNTMESVIRQKLLSVLQNAYTLLQQNNAYQLSKLSNELIQYTSVYQDAYSVSTSVMLYSLAKTLNYGKISQQEALPKIEKAIQHLEQKDDGGYERCIKDLLRLINRRDSHAQAYLRNVVELTQIKKSCAICANGISVGRAAEILGISRWDLMKQLGLTRLTETKEDRKDVETRLALVRRLFS